MIELYFSFKGFYSAQFSFGELLCLRTFVLFFVHDLLFDLKMVLEPLSYNALNGFLQNNLKHLPEIYKTKQKNEIQMNGKLIAHHFKWFQLF